MYTNRYRRIMHIYLESCQTVLQSQDKPHMYQFGKATLIIFISVHTDIIPPPLPRRILSILYISDVCWMLTFI